MKNAVIVDSVRTGLAKSHRGGFNMTRPDDMLSHIINSLLERNPNLPPDMVEDVIMGCGSPEGAQGHNLGRNAAVLSNLPITVGGTTVNRYCSSGMQTIAMAAQRVIVDNVPIAIGGGLESISLVQNDHANKHHIHEDWILNNKPELYMSMLETAEVVAKRYNISRDAMDEFGLQSQLRTAAAQKAGYFNDEIVPLKSTKLVQDKESGEISEVEVMLEQDEGVRAGTNIEGLSGLKAVLGEDKTITAGNASQLSDGASACVIMDSKLAEQRNIEPLGTFRGLAVSGLEPDEMGIGPIYAIPKLLKAAGLEIDDIDQWELNEAFASQVVYIRDHLNLPTEQLNLNGGSIAIGHPFGMTGSRQVGHLTRELKRKHLKYGVVTMCVGGGMGAAGLFESI